MIGWKFESGKTLNRGHREKTTNQKRKGSGEKTPVQRSAQYKTKGKTMIRILRLLTIAVVIQIWTGAVIYAHGQTVPTEVKQAMIASISASNRPAGGDTKGGFHEEGGMWGVTTDGKLVILASKSGPTSVKCGDGAHLLIGDFVQPELSANLATILGQWHVHPGGIREATTGAPGCVFVQPPSAADIREAACPINIVIGASDKTVYFYGLTGTTSKTKLKEFLR
jgi:hypothetical protein